MRWFLIFVSLTALLVGCRGPGAGATAGTSNEGATVDVELPPDPAVGPAAVTVRVAREGAPLEGADVEVTGDMTHAGMVPVVAAASEVEPGVYRTDAFAFDMAGDWIVTAEVDLPDGGGEARGEASTTVRRP
ncbi:MAG: hypothetical protein GVY27_10135 [Deinococcus-Thermus bacterium]|jgi:hypothetical protein|nr:hypothetical protein [Deinococcota bacterium]